MSRSTILLFALLVSLPALAQNLTVTNANLQGWTLPAGDAAPAGSIPPPKTFLGAGFETPPAGTGSLHLSVGSDGGDDAQARHTLYGGVRISALTALSYSTFTEVDGSGGQSPYLLFHVDTDGNANTADVELWFFEPLYQTSAVPPQGPLVTDTWQTWDALAGGWYTSGGLAGSGPGANVKSIAQLLAVAPNAMLTPAPAGSVRIVTGFGAGAWNNFLGAVDNFRIATATFDTTYDFEPDALATFTVTPSFSQVWTLTTTDGNGGVFGASSTIVSGPSPVPMGTGSLRLAVGADGADSAEARTTRFDGSFLRDLTELDYQAYHQSGGSGGQMGYVILRVDYDNNGTQDDLLFFEPAYQTGAFCPSNPQPAPATGAWQTWEAANGCWWSLNGIAGATQGAGVKTLAQILDVEPDARLDTGSSGGAVRIVAGFGSGAWDNFIGNVDAFNISFNPAREIYDFDPNPTVSISDVTLNEGNSGISTPYNFVVTLDKPVSYTVTVQYATADDTALAGDNDYQAVAPTAVVFAPNETSKSAPVTVRPDTKFEPNETFFVNLSNPGSAVTITDGQAIGTITNDDPQPTLSINDVTMFEGSSGTTNFVFTVTLSNPSAQTVTVGYATGPGTATAGNDYTTTSGTLTFTPNLAFRTITVQVTGDNVFEPNETFFVNLTNPTNATITRNQGLGTINNDEFPRTVSIGDVTLNEGNSGPTNFVFNVTLSGPTASTVTVDFATASVNATAGNDYTSTSGTLTFNPLVTSQQVTVVVNGDTVFEPTETFVVNLSNAQNASLGDSSGTGTITSDDPQPTISINDVTQAEGDSGTTAFVFDVTLSNPSPSTILVSYVTVDGTAVETSDYIPDSNTLTFAPFVTSQQATVLVNGETAFEADETFFVRLFAPVGATIADNQGTGTIVNDEAPFADLSITKTGPATVFRGAPITYTITVSNAGPQAASNVVVTDPIPPGATFVSATPSQGSCSGTTTVTCTLGAIGVGANATISLVVNAPLTAGPISNTATVTNTPEIDPTPGGNAGTSSAEVLIAGEIPTLSEWTLIALALALAAFAARKAG